MIGVERAFSLKGSAPLELRHNGLFLPFTLGVRSKNSFRQSKPMPKDNVLAVTQDQRKEYCRSHQCRTMSKLARPREGMLSRSTGSKCAPICSVPATSRLRWEMEPNRTNSSQTGPGANGLHFPPFGTRGCVHAFFIFGTLPGLHAWRFVAALSSHCSLFLWKI